MNPKTKLTIDQLKAISKKHGIVYKSHERINTGFSHEVHRLNDDLIIKLYDPREPKRFQIESKLLGSDLTFLKPKLIVADEGQEIGRNYVIMSYIPGTSLGSVWHEANDVQREALIKDISQILRTINKLDTAIVADEYNSWQESCQRAGEKLVKVLSEKKILDRAQAKRALKAIQHLAPVLAGSERKAVYWDIHFDNFIVDDEFVLQGVVDLENVTLSALDYPLFVVQRMTDEPEKMLREEDEQYAQKADYTKLKGWYRQYYPEMFNFEELETRIRFYQLIDALHLLQDWSHIKELWAKFEDLVSI